MKRMKIDNSEKVRELYLLNKRVDKEIEENAHYNEWRYSNLRLTLLERVFFGIYSDFNGKSNTKLFRIYIHALMRRNPNMVEQAKQSIDDGSFEGYIK